MAVSARIKWAQKRTSPGGAGSYSVSAAGEQLNDTTLEKFEFHRIQEILASYCACALGKRLAHSIRPTRKARLVRAWLNEVQELAVAAEEFSLPPFGGISDIREHVNASAFPAPLEAEPLARVAETFAATVTLRAWLTRVGPDAPALSKLADQIADFGPLAEKIRMAIDERGQVRDYATSKLASIRRTIEEAQGLVQGVFDRILKASSATRTLQYARTTFHNDRMVLPLKAEYRGRIQGIIHRTSDSGATLFVEPAESVELNNTIVRLRDKETKEVTRILRELTQLVRANAQPILAALRAVSVLDLIAAKCRYAKKRSCICPEIDDAGVLVLHEARHPLLIELFDREERDGDRPSSLSPPFQGEQRARPTTATTPRQGESPPLPPLGKGGPEGVVPIDIRLGEDFDILVITGPNTGGKTVTLKTVGLLALMTQCGVPIPAKEGSRMPVFDQILVDIGDEQSLQQSLSTFSSHLYTQLDILKQSGPKSLVLIDELGAGTDPDEGAAIGRAILTELGERRVKAIVTTHLSALKAVAYTTPRVDNAAVEFDPESLKPTYHVLLGEPGNSNALIIAKRLGMPARLVQLAHSFLDQRMGALNRAIAGTLDSRRQAEEARRTAASAALEARREREQYERQREKLERSQEAFTRWTKWIEDLKPGDEVFVKTLKRPAKVVRMELHRQRALVSAGTMDIEVPLQDIETPEQQNQ